MRYRIIIIIIVIITEIISTYKMLDPFFSLPFIVNSELSFLSLTIIFLFIIYWKVFIQLKKILKFCGRKCVIQWIYLTNRASRVLTSTWRFRGKGASCVSNSPSLTTFPRVSQFGVVTPPQLYRILKVILIVK